MARRERTGLGLRKAHPDSEYTGIRGTAKLIGRTAASAIRSAITGNTGLSGGAARAVRETPDRIEAAVEAAMQARREAQTTDSNN